MISGRYRLYGRNATGSAAVEAAFAEAGVDYDLVDVPRNAGEAAAAGYLAVNPRGQVPALVLPDGTAIAEGTAILLHIADAFPASRLAPPPGSFARAHHDRWLLFLQANIYEGELRRYYPDRYTADPVCTENVRAAAEDYVKRHYALFALMCTYGIELLSDNAEECRHNLAEVFNTFLGIDDNDEWAQAARAVLEGNIVQGDALTMTVPGGRPITFPELITG